MNNSTDLVTPNNNYEIKKVKEIRAGNIVLHPLFREDGLLFIKRYTTLSEQHIKQINMHLSAEMPILVVSSKEQLKYFLDNKLYADVGFIIDIKFVSDQIQHNHAYPIPLNSLIDERVNIDNYNKLSDEELKNSQMNHELLIETDNNKILYKVFTAQPLWNLFEKKLESHALQIRAKNIKKNILITMGQDEAIFKLINRMKDYDDLLLIKGINTSCISLLIGLTLELADKDLIELAITALFCNIGFIKMEKSVFYDFFNNSERADTINNYIKYSLEVISESSYCRNKSIVYGILDHHEYYSGGGFPLGRKGKDINLYARIILIARTYDDLVGGYLLNEGIVSTRAAITLWENRDNKFDNDILRIFLDRSNIFKIGQPYFNSGGYKGEIIGFSDYIGLPHKPIVEYKNDKVVDYSKAN